MWQQGPASRLPRIVYFSVCCVWAGPSLGQHNHSVYQGLLGLSDSEMARLTAQGII